MKKILLTLVFVFVTITSFAQLIPLGDFEIVSERNPQQHYTVYVEQSTKTGKVIYLRADAPHYEVRATPFIIAKKKFVKEFTKAIEIAEKWTETAENNNIDAMNKPIDKYNMMHLTQFVGIQPKAADSYWNAGLIIHYMKVYRNSFLTLDFIHEYSILNVSYTMTLDQAKKLLDLISEENINQKTEEYNKKDKLFSIH